MCPDSPSTAKPTTASNRHRAVGPRPATDADRTTDARRRPGSLDGRPATHRILRRGVPVLAGVVALCSTAAQAHGDAADDGHGVGFLFVVGLAATAGVVTGVVTAVQRRRTCTRSTADYLGVGVGLLLVGLGAFYALPTLAERPTLVAGGLAVGGVVAVVVPHVHAGGTCKGHADATLGAVSAHRVVEGVVLAAAYAAGSAVGLVGMVVIAAHVALETAAVGGMAAAVSRRRAVAAVVFVQAVFAAAAVGGFAASLAVPASLQVGVLGVVGGALLAVGLVETRAHIDVVRPVGGAVGE